MTFFSFALFIFPLLFQSAELLSQKHNIDVHNYFFFILFGFHLLFLFPSKIYSQTRGEHRLLTSCWLLQLTLVRFLLEALAANTLSVIFEGTLTLFNLTLCGRIKKHEPTSKLQNTDKNNFVSAMEAVRGQLISLWDKLEKETFPFSQLNASIVA